MFFVQERARPQFEQRIKGYIRRCKTEAQKEKFYIYNPVLEKREYVQPAHRYYPKIMATFSILGTMVSSIQAVYKGSIQG